MTQVSYDHRTVTIDGQRTVLLSGAIHYPRSTPAMWPDLFRRSREAGLNTIETYVFWNLHERRRGIYDFSDRLNLRRYCELAGEAGLHVILRIGPYICAETNFGGFPAWLRDVPGMQMRTDNAPFKREMARWVKLLCEHLDGLFAPQGGPIILAQIENEYENIAKNYGEAGKRYLAWAVELGESLNLGIPWIMCLGASEGAIETINAFQAHRNLDDHFKRHDDQPALWTEDWPGWYGVWGAAYRTRRPDEIAYAAARFIAGGGTGINYYMWHGGTNFGREAMYLQTTSYDFHAPLDEFGLATTKSHHLGRLHAVLHQIAPTILSSDRPTPQPLGGDAVAFEYGNVAIVANDSETETAMVDWQGESLTLTPWSARIFVDGKLAFDTSAIDAGSVVERKREPVGVALSDWASIAEPLPAERGDGVTSDQPVEQLSLTEDESDYCWYVTTLKAD